MGISVSAFVPRNQLTLVCLPGNSNGLVEIVRHCLTPTRIPPGGTPAMPLIGQGLALSERSKMQNALLEAACLDVESDYRTIFRGTGG